MKKLYLTKRMNLYFFDAKVLRKTTDSKYSFRFFLNYSRHALILATKPANAINLCRKHPQKSPPKAKQKKINERTRDENKRLLEKIDELQEKINKLHEKIDDLNLKLEESKR